MTASHDPQPSEPEQLTLADETESLAAWIEHERARNLQDIEERRHRDEPPDKKPRRRRRRRVTE